MTYEYCGKMYEMIVNLPPRMSLQGNKRGFSFLVGFVLYVFFSLLINACLLLVVFDLVLSCDAIVVFPCCRH